jgi:antitoxin (DNA-binding transcriptional repressor) of toxin-antitoxin stability system
MKVSATYLRQHIYEIIDHVLKTGEVVEIDRHGQIVELKVAPAAPRRDLSALVARDDIIIGDPEALVHLDWSGEWHP